MIPGVRHKHFESVSRYCGYVALAVVVSLTACSERDRDAIRIGIPVAPVTLDPRFATDAASYRLVRLLHRPPVDFDAAANPRPDLADWRQLSPRHYRFFIDEGARFSDGTRVLAGDVAATYRSVLEPATASPHQASLANIDNIEVVDEKTVDFHLTQPDLLFPGTLVIGVLAPNDVHAARGATAPEISSGKFEYHQTRADGTVLLRRRSDGAQFEFHTVKDATVRALKIISGELDIIQGNVPPEMFDWLSSQPGIKGERYDGATFSYLGFNLETGHSRVRNVRLAVSRAIDRASIIEYVFRGYARPAESVFPPEHWAGAPHIRALERDPERARALLADAGFRDRRLVLHYKTSSDHFRLRIATILKSQLANVRVDLEIQSLDWGTFYGDIKRGAFQVYSLSWVGLKLPDIFRHAFHSEAMPPVGANRGRYREPEVDRLIEEAERADDRSERVALYHALQERLMYDLPYIPLWFEDHLVVMRDDIIGYSTNVDGNFDALDRTSKAGSIENR